MSDAITAVTHSDPATKITTQASHGAQPASSAPRSLQSQAPSTTNSPKDIVQISTAAQQALQEALETQAQTLREAANGDPQAHRLLIKEAAARKAQK
jgi:hypothetical protein